MNPVLREMPRQALFLCSRGRRSCFRLPRAPACPRLPVWGGVARTQERQYRGSPTEGIGRWRHLLPREAPKKKKDKHQMQSIAAATDTAYGTLNVNVSGYDMTAVEHFAQYVHNLCTRLGVSVAESYSLPTVSAELMLTQESGTKMYVDSLLKTHRRVIQFSNLEKKPNSQVSVRHRTSGLAEVKIELPRDDAAHTAAEPEGVAVSHLDGRPADEPAGGRRPVSEGAHGS
ncbi:39S ribosomal protein L48, mitochondrial isoform X1 [Phycodurus eques]|uniref:39S ribosomal protein L48, mitochondrial isoform X1 n=1 Tax=Phycodurus eques TaxID=693459 RepID=UPI002ACE7858|nr:39S ribosomal protein L48, mitochondrial isoform X1 [Phycodurus eques]